jgi:hypothetical protein
MTDAPSGGGFIGQARRTACLRGRGRSSNPFWLFRLTLFALWASQILWIGTAAAQSPDPATSYAFAKASPLLVFDGPALSGGRKQSFEFGKAYEVSEQTSEYVKLKLPSGAFAYARAAHVTTVRSPRWLTTTPGYNKAERARVQLWESAAKLGQFLSGINTAGSQADYEEHLEDAPSFPLMLPAIETDTLDLLGGSRQVKIVSVMMPISREMYQALEASTSALQKKLDLHFLVDVSGSTKDFLEGTMSGLSRALRRNEDLSRQIDSIVVTKFGVSRSEASSFVGKVSLKDLDSIVWHPSGTDQTTSGEREPLIEGLAAMNAGLRSDGDAASVLIILSGADVELAGYVGAQGKTVAIENLEMKLPREAAAIFAQITPEPSEDLRNASLRIRNVSQVRYLEYEEALADAVVKELTRIAAGLKARFAPAAFTAVAKAAQERRMMPFLPREWTPGAGLPARQAYAAQSDWYTARLWLALDTLIWKETTP